jgi:hypothetical protein
VNTRSRAPRPLKDVHCDVCRAPHARLFFNGLRCTACAPAEIEIRRHAIQRAATSPLFGPLPHRPARGTA